MAAAPGLAGAALACFLVAAVLMAGWAVLAPREGFAALAFAGWAWVVTVLGLLFLGLAAIAAAFGRGRLPRWTIAATGVLFLGALAMSVAGLTYSGTPRLVYVALAGSLAVLAACARAWRLASP